MKSIESDNGIFRNDLIISAAGVLPVYTFSFPLPQETINRRNIKEAIFFIYLVLYKIQKIRPVLKLGYTYSFIFLMK
jgi:hypothetical protein